MGAVALFAAGGKLIGKKDLGSLMTTYGNIYVAQVAMGYNDAQTVRAFVEAESFDGPSLIIAYSHCINMGIDMTKGYDQQKLAVETGSWFLWRFDPRLAVPGSNPWQIDMKEPSRPAADYAYNENRFNMLKKYHPEVAEVIMGRALGTPQGQGCHHLSGQPLRDRCGGRGLPCRGHRAEPGRRRAGHAEGQQLPGRLRGQAAGRPRQRRAAQALSGRLLPPDGRPRPYGTPGPRGASAGASPWS
jgi:hypothetical protein